jgi:hypothetical protein
MRLYYRADTRSPKTIFQSGFTPRNPVYSFIAKDLWWQYGIRRANDVNSTAPKTSTTDAEMGNVICLSKKIESAPLFPVSDLYHTDYNSEIYIYVMVLPDATLPRDFNTPQQLDVFDLQALQAQEVQEIMSNPELTVNPAMAGYVLSGHEAFAKAVPVSYIICAIKCSRSDFAITAGLPVFSRTQDDAMPFAINQTRYFELGHELFMNKGYAQEEQYKQAAITELHSVKAKGLHATSNVLDALDECGINYNKKHVNTSTYFFQELTSFHIGVAFFSTLESIYFAALQLSKLMTKKSAHQSIELIENLPDSMTDVYKIKPMSFYGRYFTTVGLVTGEADPISAYLTRNLHTL